MRGVEEVEGWGCTLAVGSKGRKIEGWKKIEHDMAAGSYDMIPTDGRHINRVGG